MITIPGKIPISIRPLFWFVALLIGWLWTRSLTGAFLALFVILVSIIVHEFGHALTALAFRQRTRIELAAFGGFTYREGERLPLWKEFFVVLNGPLAGLMLAAVSFLLYRYVPLTNPVLNFIVRFSLFANVFWTIVNLVPVMPLDGGHLLSISLEALFGFKGIKAAIFVGLIVSIAICVVAFVFGQFLIGAVFLILTFESFRSLRYYRIFKEQDRSSDLQALLKEADGDLQNGLKPAAVEKLEKVREASKEGILYTMATQQLAEVYRLEERYDEAYQLLLPIHKALSGTELASFHFLAHMCGDYQMVAKIGSRCYQENPTHHTALMNALAHAALKEVEPACGWLDCALREGLPSLSEALSHPEFDPIRDDPRFKRFSG